MSTTPNSATPVQETRTQPIVRAIPLLRQSLSLILRNKTLLGGLCVVLGIATYAFWWSLTALVSKFSPETLFSVPAALQFLLYLEAFRIASHHLVYHTYNGRQVTLPQLWGFVRRIKGTRHHWVVLGVAAVEDILALSGFLAPILADLAGDPQLAFVLLFVWLLLMTPLFLQLFIALPLSYVYSTGVMSCLRQARELTFGHGGLIFRLNLLIGLLLGPLLVVAFVLLLLLREWLDVPETQLTIAGQMLVFVLGPIIAVVSTVCFYELLPTNRDPDAVQLELTRHKSSEFHRLNVLELRRSKGAVEIVLRVKIDAGYQAKLFASPFDLRQLRLSADDTSRILNVDMKVLDKTPGEIRVGLVHRGFEDSFSWLFCSASQVANRNSIQ